MCQIVGFYLIYVFIKLTFKINIINETPRSEELRFFELLIDKNNKE